MVRVPTTARVAGAMTQWLIWLARVKPEWNVDLTYTASFGIAAGRNMMTRELMESDCTHLWMLDSDTVPPYSLHLTDNAKQFSILCGPYVGCMDGNTFWNVYKNINRKYIPIPRRKWPKERVFRADAAGSGCMLIRREVFDRLSNDPWEYEDSGNGQLGTEDLYFCNKVGGVYIDSHYSCRHYRETDLLDVAKIQAGK